jgi:ribosomal RNA-processing protein 9
LHSFTTSDSIDCITLINEEQYISGSNDGSLGIWNINKKKPISIVKNAHKQSSISTGWISAVSSYHNTDLLASGN